MLPSEIAAAVLFRMSYDKLQARDGWEQARKIAYCSILPHMDKGKRKSPNKWMPLPWDNEGKNSYENMTMDEIREQFKNSPAIAKN